MTLHIVDPQLVAKISDLARAIGVPETEIVKRAIGALDREQAKSADWNRFHELIQDIRRLPDLPNAGDPLEWDEHGLPI